MIAQAVYRDTLVRLINPNTEWLDLGCGRELIRSWLPGAVELQQGFKSTCKCIVGIDGVALDVLRNPYLHTGFVGDLLHLPFPAQSFTLVTANMVVEHVSDPAQFLSEVRRVLRPDGTFVFLTPNLFHPVIALARLTPDWIKRPMTRWLEHRNDHDIFPAYYRLNTARKVRQLLGDYGFG